MELETKTKAELFYEKHLEYRRRYNEENRDKVRQNSLKWFREKLMANPDKYKEYLEKKKQKYQEKKNAKKEGLSL